MCFDWLHHCPMGVQGWGLWSLVGWMLGGPSLELDGEGGGKKREEEQNTKNGCSRVRTSYMVLCARNYNPRYFSKNSLNLRMTDVLT